MLMSTAGTVIRCPVADIRICGRSSKGVITFRVSDGEVLLSTTRLAEDKFAVDAERRQRQNKTSLSSSKRIKLCVLDHFSSIFTCVLQQHYKIFLMELKSMYKK